MIRMYGSRISYYAGKVETYLRYRGLEYELLSMVDHQKEILAGAGAVQSPVLRLEDGRWMSDSTPIMAWFESERGGTSIFPADPGMGFVAALLEDYADEWLWRPAMHYRWSYRLDNQHASGTLADELMSGRKAPRFLKRMVVARRQLRGFVQNDGVNPTTRPHVESTTFAAFDLLEAILAKRPFVLGDRPTNADFGFVGPMLRHFSQDPTPAELMRQRAPRVYAWVARMWEADDANREASLITEIDAPLGALLREACETHVVQLAGNARAHAQGDRHFDQQIQGCPYTHLPVSRYRVWCLEELRRQWHGLDSGAQQVLRPHLPEDEASPLWTPDPAAVSGYDAEGLAPFNRAINVFGTGVPS